MNITYTAAEVAPRVSKINDIEGGVEVVFEFDGVEHVIPVTPANILADTKETSFADCSTYYGLVSTDGRVRYINKYLVTYYTKDNGFVVNEALKEDAFASIQIYVPFGGESLAEATIRVNSCEPPLHNGAALPADKLVDDANDGLKNFRLSTLPGLAAQVAGDKVNVQLLMNGKPINRAGVLVYAIVKDSLAYTTGLTDANGAVSFDVVPNATIKFGFKHFTNAASVTT